jgi:ubiquinone/menaquinone biosynthesis C-methylase UbiE
MPSDAQQGAIPGNKPQPHLSVDQAYALWSQTYDSVPNPMLALEQRYLCPMLPALTGKTVLDLGCGTGRLLDRLPPLGTGRYFGIDRSDAMLERAAKKLLIPGCLLRADCLRLPLRSRSADVVIASFVLGYVDLSGLASEVARVSNDEADLYLSEFHPENNSLSWKRNFRSGNRVIELPTNSYSLRDIEDTFRAQGFDHLRTIEPGFGEPEREIFLAHNKSHVFEASRGLHAIFISHWRRSEHAD